MRWTSTEDHRSIRVWLLLVMSSLVLSSAIMFISEPSITGYLSFDTGPDINLNPDLITEEDYYSQTSSALFYVVLIIILQVGIYVFVTRFYSHLD